VTFLEMDTECLKFEDDTFDAVCISYSLHHLENIDRVSAEMKRVLKPDGILLFRKSLVMGNRAKHRKRTYFDTIGIPKSAPC
jgi:ubiquinone/menaquinone biosynthesis C-methylase UbiE